MSEPGGVRYRPGDAQPSALDAAAARAGASPAQRCFRTHSATILCWLVLVAAVLHPPHGMGVPLCPSRLISGVSCPGCGMSRSLSCAVRGDVHASLGYHPFGFAFLTMFTLGAIVGVLPRTRRHKIEGWFHRRRRPVFAGALIFLLMFLGHGADRARRELQGTKNVKPAPPPPAPPP